MKVWLRDSSQEDLDADLLSAADLAYIPITAGKPLADQLNFTIQVRVRYRRPRPAAFRAGPITIVDPNVRQAIEAARTSVEFHPVDVKDASAKDRPVLRYWFLNIMSELDCLDRQRSEYRDVSGDVEHIRQLRLKDDCAVLDLFRLAGTVPRVILVSDPLAASISTLGRSGLKFVDVDEYTDPRVDLSMP